MTSWTELEARLRARLDPLDRIGHEVTSSDFTLNDHVFERPPSFRAAAVLAPIIKRPEGWTMLFTERAADLPSHPGQISFPGGRCEEGETPVAAALRETEEEIALSRSFIEPIGGFGAYETGSGYRIAPVVALVEPGFTLRPDPREVASIFEAPFEFLMDSANHERREGLWNGVTRSYYAMPYGDRNIWGATAGMIRALYEKLYL